MMQQWKQFRSHEQCLNLSERPSGVESRIFANNGVVHSECQRHQAEPHGTKRHIASEPVSQFGFDFWTIVIDVYKCGYCKRCNHYKSDDDSQANNDTFSHGSPPAPKLLLIVVYINRRENS